MMNGGQVALPAAAITQVTPPPCYDDIPRPKRGQHPGNGTNGAWGISASSNSSPEHAGSNPKDKIIATINAKDDIIARQAMVMKFASAVLEADTSLEAIRGLVAATCRVVNCDRVSIFLPDPEAEGRLICAAAPAGGDVGWSLPIGVGIAGHVALTGEGLNIPDAYQCPNLFDAAHDRETGYRTMSILCMPLLSSEKKVLGVVEAINKIHDPEQDPGQDFHFPTNMFKPFDDVDQRMLSLLLTLTSHQIYVKRLNTERSEATAVAETMLNLVEAFCAHGELEAGINALAAMMCQLGRCKEAFIWVPDSGGLICRGAFPESCQDFLGTRLPPSDDSVITAVARSGQAKVLRAEHTEDLQKLARQLASRAGADGEDTFASPVVGSAACMPLKDIDSGEIVGIVLATNKVIETADVEFNIDEHQAACDYGDAAEANGDSSETPKARRSSLKMRSKGAMEQSLATEAVSGTAFYNAKPNAEFKEADMRSIEVPLRLAAQMVKTGLLFDTERRANRKLRALLTLVPDANMALEAKNLMQVVSEISSNAVKIFECDRCTFFVVDNFNRELVGYFTNECGELKDFRVELKGIAGIVATEGRTLNIRDAWNDDRFSNAKDRETGYRTRTILCAPLRASSGKVIAVLQCINKINYEYYTQDDETMMQAFSVLLSDLVQRILSESSYETFIKSSGTITSDVKSLFKQYYSAGDDDHAHHGDRTRGHKMSMLYDSEPSAAPMNYADQLRCWDFDQLKPFQDEIGWRPYTQAVFKNFELYREFNVALPVAANFFETLQSKYSVEAAYHNWNHAFSTMHVGFLLLSSPAFLKVFTKAEIFALLLAALGHDAEHPGLSNAFQVQMQSPVALLYNDFSVLENHHASVTCVLLKDTAMLERLEKSAFRRVRQIIVTSILATDMAKHNDSIKWMETNNVHVELPEVRKGNANLSVESRTELSSALLHCADVSHPVLPWELHKVMSFQVATEFYTQFQEETRLGLPTLPFMGKDPQESRGLAPIQTGFLQFVVAPLWSALNFVAGEDHFKFAVENLDRNKKRWQKIGDGEDVTSEEQFFLLPDGEEAVFSPPRR